jgi:PPK2 family polyphosphate:nucleotide phosphotransferase
MKKHTLERARNLARPFRIVEGDTFHLRDFSPETTAHFGKKGKQKAKRLLQKDLLVLEEFQERLYAEGKRGLVIIFQAMDAAGKDSTIKHVMSGVNPQGCQVFSFKAPSQEELDEDFLRRCTKCLPLRGRIGIFNRSYYEETLVVRVHPEILQKQKIPGELITKDVWKQRFQDIRAFERYLSRNGFAVIKFFLHVSKKEQQRRFMERVSIPKKNWKFTESDIQERSYWNQYQRAYESTIQHTAHKRAPWYVVPADHKWFARLVVASAIIDTLAKLDPQYPKTDPRRRKELATAFHKDGKKS